MKINRVFNTVKYMNSRQLRYRLKYEITKRVRKNIEIKGDFIINSNYQFRNKNFVMKNNNIILSAEKILNNQFTFLNNLTYRFEEEIDWNINPFNYRLWNFNLNYFDFLEILYNAYKMTEDIKYLDKGIELILSWIEKNEKYDVNTWDPYVVSKRLFNFINFIADINAKYKIDKLDKINNSIYIQSKYLSKNIEYYLDANHVIMDGKGLVFAGVYLNEFNLLEKGISILVKEYTRQVLCDGGHYERSPSYQVEVLSHYVECYILLSKNELSKKGENLIKLIDKMSEYLNRIIMPNGNIPLLNDSSLDYPFKADDLLQVCSAILDKKLFYSENLSDYALSILDNQDIDKLIELKEDENNVENIMLKESGYYIIRDLINEEKVYILFDCGDGGPDYNLGHTHADSLNLILTIGDSEFLIDSGTYTYKIGNDRNYYRSTLAHNTITIDNKNSSDVWSGFMVSKRAKSFVKKYIENENYIYICAYHDGYSKVLGKDKVTHIREVIYIKGKGLFIVDSIDGQIKDRHEAIINYNIKKENFNRVDNTFSTDKNKLYFNINREFNVNIDKYSDQFSIEKECYSAKAKWEFDKTTSVITSIFFNNSKLDITLNKNDIDIIENKVKIMKINRWYR